MDRDYISTSRSICSQWKHVTIIWNYHFYSRNEQFLRRIFCCYRIVHGTYGIMGEESKWAIECERVEGRIRIIRFVYALFLKKKVPQLGSHSCIKIRLERIPFFFFFCVLLGPLTILSDSMSIQKKVNRNHFNEHAFFPCLILLLHFLFLRICVYVEQIKGNICLRKELNGKSLRKLGPLCDFKWKKKFFLLIMR